MPKRVRIIKITKFTKIIQNYRQKINFELINIKKNYALKIIQKK